jgi:hypothetical protein
LVPAFIACGGEPTPTVIGPSGADAIVESLILAYDANDYFAYLKLFNETATGTVGMDWFSQTSNIIIKKVGHYIPNSKVLTTVTPNGDLTDLTYKAQYEHAENGVQVIVSLIISENATYAAGIWFNAPELFK